MPALAKTPGRRSGHHGFRPGRVTALLTLTLSLASAVGGYLLVLLMCGSAGVQTSLAEAITRTTPDVAAILNRVERADPLASVWEGLTAEQLDQLAATLGDEARVAGFTSACQIGSGPTFGRSGTGTGTGAESPKLCYIGVTPNYFALMGLRLTEGRLFTETSLGECVLGSGVSAVVRTVNGKHSFVPHVPTELAVVGTLAPVEGDVIPAGPGWFFEFPVDLCVFTLPGQVPDIVGTGIPIPAPTGTFALIQPLGDNPGEIIGRARDLISSWYPRHSILVTTGGLGRVVLEGTQRRLEAYFAAVTGAFLLLACLTMANLVLYDVVRSWRALGIRRAVGASRVQIWSGLVGGALAACLVGSLVGVVLALVTGRSVATALGFGWSMNWLALAMAGVIVLLGALSAGLGSLRATRAFPRSSLAGARVDFRGLRLDLRRLLAGLSVAVAVGGLVLVVGAGAAGQAYLTAYLRAAGERTVTVRGGDPSGSDTARAYERLRTSLPSGYAVALQSTMTAGVSIDGNSPPITASAYVVDGAFLEVRGFDLDAAPGTSSSIEPAGRPEVYLGHDLARALFGGDEQSAWGQALFVDGQAFRVAGVLVDRPAAAVDPVLDRDWSVILRLADAKDLPSYAVGASKPEVWLVPPEGVTAEEAAQDVTALVAAEEGLVVRPLIEEVATLRRARQATNLALLMLAAGGLVLGGLGVSAFFFSHTVEQAREDAIRRSVGATKRHVFVRVVRQAAILGLVAGGFGYVLGSAAALAACVAQGWPSPISASLGIWSVLIAGALAVGSAAGPALQASGQSLGAVLRREE